MGAIFPVGLIECSSGGGSSAQSNPGGGSSSSSGGGSGTGASDDGGASADAADPVVWDGSGILNSWFDGGTPALTANVTIRIAGDSTACIFPATDPRVGWGAVFQQFFGSGVTIDDEAQSGRSSKSFIDEGWWAMLKAKIVPGDYVFIEFGHNDEKTDPTLYTDPATTFQDYLRTYVTDTRAAGGFPVLLTPISRRQFSGATIEATHGLYPGAMINLAELTSTPVIDVTTTTAVWLEGLGPVNSVPMFAPGDDTHLSAMGAPVVGQLVVQGIELLGLPLVARLQE